MEAGGAGGAGSLTWVPSVSLAPGSGCGAAFSSILQLVILFLKVQCCRSSFRSSKLPVFRYQFFIAHVTNGASLLYTDSLLCTLEVENLDRCNFTFFVGMNSSILFTCSIAFFAS